MISYFVYNQLRVNPFLLYDRPFPGFEIVTWDNQSFITGSLVDTEIGEAYIEYGNELIRGQIWKTEDLVAGRKLEDAIGLASGLLELIKIEATIMLDDAPKEEKTLETYTFALKSLDFAKKSA